MPPFDALFDAWNNLTSFLISLGGLPGGGVSVGSSIGLPSFGSIDLKLS